MNLLVNTKVALKRYFEQEGAFGFLKDTSQAKYFLRIQQQGNCFMNAPAVFFAYILQFLDLYEDGVHGAVDVAKFIRRSFTDPELYDYVREGSGGNADAVLKTILKPLLGFDATTTGIRPRNDIIDQMRECGPGIVTGFKVSKQFSKATPAIKASEEGKVGYIQFTNRFRNEGKFVELAGDASDKHKIEVELENFLHCESIADTRKNLFESVPVEASTSSEKHNDCGGRADEKHAMVLGGRCDTATGKTFLLLQNWWDPVQLVEVDEAYLRSTRADFRFVHPDALRRQT